MRLERIALQLRRRNAWEAIDLGRSMLQAWAAPAYRAWLATYWVVGLALLLALWSRPGLAIAILWWLKPLFDRVLLFVFSRAVFGGDTTLADLRSHLPTLLREPGILSALTLRRFSLVRSFLLPVWQLELQRGQAARARFKVLARRDRSAAVWLIFICANLMPVLAFSLVIVTDLLFPGDYSPVLEDLFSAEKSSIQQFAVNVFVMVAESIVEPLYVASGFALYLNRRSELEGWDIELAFRNLAARASEGRAARAAAALLAAVGVLLITAGTPSPVWAAAPSASEESAPRRAIAEVLADPVFGKEVEEMRWQPIPKKNAGEPQKYPEWWKSFLRGVEFFGEVLRAFVWIAALLLAAALLYLLLHYAQKLEARRAGAARPPDYLFGLDVRAESLPADVAAAARTAIDAGRFEEALSLLYRGALVVFIHRLQIDFRAGDTEDDCLRRVAGTLDEPSCRFFAGLLDAWRNAAYAHRRPPRQAAEQLCDEWRRHFGTPVAP